MHHSDVAYWRYLQSLPRGHADLPSPRVCRLLLRLFESWQQKPRWITEHQIGHLFRGRAGLSEQEATDLAVHPLPIRKAKAIARMLELVTSPELAMTGSSEIQPDQLLLGSLPPFSVGQGKEFVRYLTQEEELKFALQYLNELSPMGHIVPDYEVVLGKGLKGLIQDCEEFLKHCAPGQAAFYNSVIISLQAVIDYAARFAALAEQFANALREDDPNRQTLRESAARLRHSPANPPRTFHEAVQAIFIVHCTLHWTVEIVPFGRLDQILWPFYRADIESQRLTKQQAQEILDCFWVKLDERVILNYRHAEDRFTSSDGTLTGTGGASNFDQGGLLNQWMQQITIGGIVADDEDATKDASNELSHLFIECARRLPLNSPTLDLRVHSGTPRTLIEAAAAALLSGGAHPVLLNDDRIVPALESLSGGKISRRSARNYACDGCYETMFAGETEFSFGFVPALDALEKTLNRGAQIGAAGPVHLRGNKDSWRTAPAAAIGSFEDLWAILRDHILLGCHRYLNSLLTFYGNKAGVAPSPLLSALIGGCIESGRDLVEGGARYHIFSPLMTGISTAADSLFAIRRLVFEERQFTLPELVTCLLSNWGRNTVVPGPHVNPDRIAEIRAVCMAQPKFGHGDPEVDAIAWRLIEDFTACVEEARANPVHHEGFTRLRNFDAPGKPFELLLAPGVGTFEQYVLGGGFAGATADGRFAGDPIASDLSPAPLHGDENPAPENGLEKINGQRHRRETPIARGLQSYAHPSMNLLPDGAPADYNIPEDFPSQSLANVIESFAKGNGGSVCTFTVADPATFAGALSASDDFNLVRVRMGGWTEFFIALFPAHKAQHQRRPLYIP